MGETDPAPHDEGREEKLPARHPVLAVVVLAVGVLLVVMTAAMTKAGWTVDDTASAVSSDDGGSAAGFSKDGITVVLILRDEGRSYTDFTAAALPSG